MMIKIFATALPASCSQTAIVEALPDTLVFRSFHPVCLPPDLQTFVPGTCEPVCHHSSTESVRAPTCRRR